MLKYFASTPIEYMKVGTEGRMLSKFIKSNIVIYCAPGLLGKFLSMFHINDMEFCIAIAGVVTVISMLLFIRHFNKKFPTIELRRAQQGYVFAFSMLIIMNFFGVWIGLYQMVDGW